MRFVFPQIHRVFHYLKSLQRVILSYEDFNNFVNKSNNPIIIIKPPIGVTGQINCTKSNLFKRLKAYKERLKKQVPTKIMLTGNFIENLNTL